ncbi:hypothetical protein HanPSC8_Chr16g0730411 [Helianthus annuus]|nr:hypothetical protein HanPSC8_Chr16g0730411 [Helianthus annuus]
MVIQIEPDVIPLFSLSLSIYIYISMYLCMHACMYICMYMCGEGFNKKLVKKHINCFLTFFSYNLPFLKYKKK